MGTKGTRPRHRGMTPASRRRVRGHFADGVICPVSDVHRSPGRPEGGPSSRRHQPAKSDTGSSNQFLASYPSNLPRNARKYSA